MVSGRTDGSRKENAHHRTTDCCLHAVNLSHFYLQLILSAMLHLCFSWHCDCNSVVYLWSSVKAFASQVLLTVVYFHSDWLGIRNGDRGIQE